MLVYINIVVLDSLPPYSYYYLKSCTYFTVLLGMDDNQIKDCTY